MGAYGTAREQHGRAASKSKVLRMRLDQIEKDLGTLNAMLQVLHVRQSCLVRHLELEEVHTPADGGKMTVSYRSVKVPQTAPAGEVVP